MTCSDHTVTLAIPDGVGSLQLKVDTRRSSVVGGPDGYPGEIHNAHDLARLTTTGRPFTLTITSRRDRGVTMALAFDATGRCIKTASSDGALLELFANTTFPCASRYEREPLFSDAHRSMAWAMGATWTRAETAALLHVGVGPMRLSSFLDAGAGDAPEILALHRSGISPDQLAAWRTLEPTISVRQVRRHHQRHLTPERIVEYAEVLLGSHLTPAARPGPAARMERVVAAFTGPGARPGTLPPARLWDGPAPLVPYLHALGISPIMLKRGIAAEEARPGQGAYLSKLSRVLRGQGVTDIQLLDYTLLRHLSEPGAPVALHINDGALVGHARHALRRGASTRAAVREAVTHTMGSSRPLLTSGAQLEAMAQANFTNGHAVAGALWAEQVRSGAGQAAHGDLSWVEVKDAVHGALRDQVCPTVASRHDRDGMGLIAYEIAATPGRSAAERQALRHVYVLHPLGGCTDACHSLADTERRPTVVLEGMYAELLHPYRTP